MQVRWRKELEEYLSRFVAAHRGLRFGRLFGLPAAYAGRTMFSCVVEDGITARLPVSALESALDKGAARWRGSRSQPSWVIFRPKTSRQTDAVSVFLEIAARHAALEGGRTRS